MNELVMGRIMVGQCSKEKLRLDSFTNLCEVVRLPSIDVMACFDIMMSMVR